jgi:hypothetical protein
MSKHASFQVDPRLASLLGETYRSSEQSIKELVDNAWDADATHVWITLPAAMTFDPVIVRDDGSGMTEREVRQEYLRIARDRRAAKGERTPERNRKVKGRRGIGKFAGLMVADRMELVTRTRGVETQLAIPKDELLQSAADLEKLPLPIATAPCDADQRGTTVSLYALHQRLLFPEPERLKQLLVIEYGREECFTVLVNGVALGLEDVPGKSVTTDANLPEVGPVRLRLRIADQPKGTKCAGISIRVGGKIVGTPSFFGLDDCEDIPPKLLRRVHGEVEADGLIDDVTADWGGVIENSRGFAALEELVRQTVRTSLKQTFRSEMNLAKGRVQQEINRRLAELPEYRRDFARRAMERIMLRFYEQPEERIQPIVSVVLDALERDEYWQVLDKINAARHGDVGVLADALHDFGVLELAMVGQQARRRLEILDQLDALIADDNTLEKIVHTALETNLWILGSQFALMSSNWTLRRIVDDYTDRKFVGARANKRPDLVLLSNVSQRHTLVEFKRPSYTIDRPDVSQAEQYRDDLLPLINPIDVWVVGKDYNAVMLQNMPPNVTVASYAQLISRARVELDWLLGQLVGGVAA